MPKRQIHLFYGIVVSWFIVFVQVAAHAQTTSTGQTITVVTNSQSTQLLDANGNTVNRDYIPDHPFWVNRNECAADWQYQIGVTTAGINGYPFEVWASNGGDCTVLTSRFPPTPSCWKVYSQSSFAQGTSGTTTLYIPARTILGGHTYAGATDTISIIPGTENDCNPTLRTDTVPSTGVALTLYFFAFGNGSSGTPTASTTWTDVGYDLIGPTPPSTVSVAAADTELYVNWAQVLDSDLAGYHIYCTPPVPPVGYDADASTLLSSATGGATAAGGSGATGGSSDAGGSSATGGSSAVASTTPAVNPNCPDKYIFQGNFPPAGMGYNGRADGVTPTSGVAGGLVNGQQYACAISAYDTRENDGPFSVVACGKPWWVQDFYSTYRNVAHGKGGGGFCSVGQMRSGVGLLIPLASLCLLALRRVRKSNRKSDNSST